MDHGLNVRLIDSHTEGNGAAQDSDLVGTELLLRECSLLVTFACMIGGTLNSLLAQVAGNLLRGLALCREEKNWGYLLVAFWLQQRHQRFCLLLISGYRELEVQSWEVGLGHQVIWELNVENFADLLLRWLRSCRSKSQDDSIWAEFFSDHLVQHQICGSEIMGPLAGAVDFINTDHRDFSPELLQVLCEQTFWRYEQSLYFTFLDCLYHFLLEVEALLAIQGSAWDEVRQFVELVSH